MSKTIGDYLDEINKACLIGEDTSQNQQSIKELLVESLAGNTAQFDKRQEQVS